MTEMENIKYGSLDDAPMSSHIDQQKQRQHQKQQQIDAENCQESSVVLVDPEYPSESTVDGILKENKENQSDYCNSAYGWKECLLSWRFFELVVCVIPSLATIIYFEVTPITPRMRPIPYQEVVRTGGTGEISSTGNLYGGYESKYTNVIWNLVHAETIIGDTVSHRAYQVLMGLCPWLLQLLLVWVLAPRNAAQKNAIFGDRWDALHRTTCVYFVGIGLTDTITNCVKFYVGYLRPVFLDVCQPYYDTTDSTFYCTNENLDSRIGFPSDHSAWSFCGMMLLSMYFERNFGQNSIRASIQEPIDRKRQPLYRLASLLSYIPMLFAIFVAASRIVDNKHFPADVIGGAILGGSVASLVFGIWFPQQL